MVEEMLSSWRGGSGGRSSRGLGMQSPGVSCVIYREKGNLLKEIQNNIKYN